MPEKPRKAPESAAKAAGMPAALPKSPGSSSPAGWIRSAPETGPGRNYLTA